MMSPKNLSRDSNYIVDVLMWPKFGNCSISMRQVITTSISYATLTYKLEILHQGLKLKARKFLGLIPRFAEVTGEKLVGLKHH